MVWRWSVFAMEGKRNWVRSVSFCKLKYWVSQHPLLREYVGFEFRMISCFLELQPVLEAGPPVSFKLISTVCVAPLAWGKG